MLVVALLAALTPQTAEAVSHAALAAAAKDARFEITSQLDVDDTINHEAARQACGAEVESCASQLANAYDARLVLFLRVYAVGDEAHVALTLRDLKENRVVARSDVAGEEKTLFALTQQETTRALAAFTADGATKLFISRAAIDLPASAPAPAPAPAAPPSPLVIGGAATSATGVALAVVGTVVGLANNGVMIDPQKTTADKDSAETLRTAGYVGAGVGAAAVLVGGGLLAWGLVSE